MSSCEVGANSAIFLFSSLGSIQKQEKTPHHLDYLMDLLNQNLYAIYIRAMEQNPGMQFALRLDFQISKNL